jgi:hypothetical protein
VAGFSRRKRTGDGRPWRQLALNALSFSAELEAVRFAVAPASRRHQERFDLARYAERSKLTIRMSCRRFTRLTNAFSKKIENHALAVSLHMMFYNFGRIHKSLRITPAMAGRPPITCGR